MKPPGFADTRWQRELMEFLKIIVLSMAAVVLYGVLHEQVTVRLCLEYFTVCHTPVFPTSDPTLLAFGWGIQATWLPGLLLGILLAFAARLGPPPRRTARDLLWPVAMLMLSVGLVASLAGVAGSGQEPEDIREQGAAFLGSVSVANWTGFVADLLGPYGGLPCRGRGGRLALRACPEQTSQTPSCVAGARRVPVW